MKLSKKEAIVILTLALLGVYQVCVWVHIAYNTLQDKQDYYYEIRQSR